MGISQEIAEKIIDHVNNQKEDLIRDRINELGLNFEYYKDILVHKKVRFNPFIVEHHENFGSLIYYNDGTENGLFVMGFKDPSFDFNMDTKINFGFDYFIEEPEWNKLPKVTL